MRTYKIQIKMIDHRQIEIQSPSPLQPGQIEELATQQARAEFGECDEIEIVEFSVYGCLAPTNQDR